MLLVNITINGSKFTNASIIAPIAKDMNAASKNLPFNLTSADSDLNDLRANKIPVKITTSIMESK